MAKRSPVEDAAVRWWRGKRPSEWKEALHLKNPTVNCTTMREHLLAKQVVALLSIEKLARDVRRQKVRQ